MNIHTLSPASSHQAPISLLHRIAQDDEFRARLEADPVAAFAEVGVELDTALVPERVELPHRLELAGPNNPLDDLGRDIGGGGTGWRGLLG